MPALRFNQYNVAVLRPSSHSVRSDFAQFIARKFGRGPFLVVGQELEELIRQFGDAQLVATFCGSADELTSAIPQNGSEPQADLAIWFYAPSKRNDEQAVQDLTCRARDVLLIGGVGVEMATRRPHLVECFRKYGLWPDYACDLEGLNPTALRLIRRVEESNETLVPAVELAFARLNRHVGGLERTLDTRISELEAADRHITELEERLLKLKEAKRALKQLKQEKQTLRSREHPEGVVNNDAHAVADAHLLHARGELDGGGQHVRKRGFSSDRSSMSKNSAPGMWPSRNSAFGSRPAVGRCQLRRRRPDRGRPGARRASRYRRSTLGRC